MSVGSNIKKWRQIRNLRQSDLAKLIGVSDKTVSSWEINRTEPQMAMIEKISAALDCKKIDIIGTDMPVYTNNSHYFNEETLQIAKEVSENPILLSLFQMVRDIPSEHLKAYIEFMGKLKT